ncbi:Ig-like domain-containing protein [Phytoactinopolyspora halotolerans]|uniref:Fibronectin type III domain-containing protein n=1 Tax=Phytoactinopolyspora halotolerans TaxID=1981512 RepID=A0A6L9SE11_9ACTN|nr:Ig-like domain-containing protein [Phytoactinopolyspora halotolerans]NEE02742.1 fibronectin type III domain-containing protein [Phytoactinopolyspora halotolerans]
MHHVRGISLWRSWILGLAVAVLAAILAPVPAGSAVGAGSAVNTGSAVDAVEPEVTIDSHASGDQVSVGTVRLEGRFVGAYDLEIVVDGVRTARVHVTDPDADDRGTWHYDLDTTPFDGEIQVTVRGKKVADRYGVWSPFVELNVDNPAANVPEVEILSPADGTRVDGTTPVRIAAAGRNPIESVQVRVNGGPWRTAQGQRGRFLSVLDARELGDTMASIEARAVDTHGNEGRSTTTYAQVGDAAPEEVLVQPQDRAVWIWEHASYNLILNDGSRQLLDTLATDTDTFDSDPITTLYFGVDTYGELDMLEDRRPAVRDFITWAHEHGYQVYATIAGGTRPPFFGGFERYHHRAVREMEKILNYNLSSADDERFDGVNVDIEPYIHSDFRARKPELQRQWLDILETMIERRDAAGSGLVFGPAIPRWLDTSDCCDAIEWKGETKPLSEHMQDLNDYISIMNYRDTADGGAGLVAQMRNEIAYAESIGKPNSVVSGVETLDIVGRSGDPETITFREEGRTALERELDTLYAAYADSPAFGGVAMHHYDSIRELPSAWGAGAVLPPLPPDDGAPTQLSDAPTATAFDHQSIDLSYGRAYDDVEVQRYNVYRSTSPDVAPTPENLATRSRGLDVTDTGLLPETTYYYRVAAVDVHGNEGPASAVTSATTGPSESRPMVVDGLELTVENSRATARAHVVDLETGEPVSTATVHGRFTKAAGRYLELAPETETDGWVSGTSESLPATGTVGFLVDRITAPGHYWASAYDESGGIETAW